MIQTVIKRDGRIVGFDKERIASAIRKAMLKTDKGEDEELINQIVDRIEIKGKEQTHVDEIQDMVEKELMKSSRKDAGKIYITYRNQRDIARKAKTREVFLEIIEAKNNDITRENANMNADTPAGMMMKFASETTKPFVDDYLLSESSLNAVKNNYLHIHDKDYYPSKSLTCVSSRTNITIKTQDGDIKHVKASYFDKYFDSAASVEPQMIEPSKFLWVMGRNGWTKITGISRRLLSDEDTFYKLKTHKGCGIEVTGEHLIPVIDKDTNNEVIKKVDDIIVGDKLIQAIALDTTDLNNEYIDVVELLMGCDEIKKEGIIVKNIKELREWLRYRYKIQSLPKYLNSTTYRYGTYYITLPDLYNLMENFEIPYDVLNSMDIHCFGGKDFLPMYLPITNELAKIIGYLHTDGSISYIPKTGNYQVAFNGFDKDINENFKDAFSKVFVNNLAKRKQNGKDAGYLFSSKLLALLFKKVLGHKNGSSDISVPDFILNGKDCIKWSYLSAVIDGDGSIGKTLRDGIRISSVCKSYLEEMNLLLKSLDVNGNISEKCNAGSETKFPNGEICLRNYNNYNIVILGREDVEKVLENLNCIKQRRDDRIYAQEPSRGLLYAPSLIKSKMEISTKDEVVYDLETVEHWWTANGYIIHNCLQHPLNKILNEGFVAGHGESRPTKRIETASIIGCISMETVQNEMHGGQAIPAFDYYLAPFVRKSYIEEAKALEQVTGKDLKHLYDVEISDYEYKDLDGLEGDERYKQHAINKTVGRVHQSMEAFIHNMNTIHCVDGDELVWVFDESDGRFKGITIREISDTFRPSRYKVLSINKEGKSEWKYIYGASFQGKKDVYKVIGKNGHAVHVTDNHRIATVTENKEIAFDYPKNIKNIVIPKVAVESIYEIGYKWDITKYSSRKKQNYNLPYIEVNVELCELLGYYVADGCVVGGSEIAFSVCNETEMMERIIYLMKKVYGNDITYHTTEYSKPKKVSQIRFNVGKVWALNWQDVCGHCSKEKKVPFFVLGGTDMMQRSFLRGYLMCDGSIKHGEGYYDAASISEELISGLDLMYLQRGEYQHRNIRVMKDFYDKEKFGNNIYTINFSGNSNKRMKLGLDVYSELEYPKYNKEFSNENYFAEDLKTIELYKENADVYDIAVEDNENFLTASNVIIHNSRGGNQVVFSSINYGTDTSAEGRCVIRELLKSTYEGIGNGSTAIFPIQIWKKKRGVSYLPEDRNFDLYKLACKVAARRFFPNFVNLDATFNQHEMWNPEDPERYKYEVATMGCVDGQEVVTYKYDEQIFVAPISEFWNNMKELGFEVNDSSIEGFKEGEFMDLSKIEILDGENFVECLRVIKNPDKGDWMKITTTNGRVLTVTSDHPWSIVDKGVVLTKDLKIGDKVVLESIQKEIKGKENSIDEKTAWLKGFILCDGCYDGRMMSTVGMDEQDIVQKYCSIFENVIGSKTNVREQHRGVKGDYIELKNYCEDNGIIKNFRKSILNEFRGLKKIDRHIPQWVFNSNEDVKIAFLAGMMDADGYINNQRLRSKCQLGSTNKSLAIETCILIQSIGYPAKIFENHYGNSHSEKIRYRVEFDAFGDLIKNMASEKKKNNFNYYDKPIYFNDGEISKIEFIGFRDECSYDVTTLSEHFTVSGIRSHNCRTRVFENRFGEKTSIGRGNLSFSTINIVKLAIECMNIENEDERIKKFFEKLDEMLEITASQLCDRYDFQKTALAKQFPLLMSGLWNGSEKLKPTDTVESVLNQGTLGIGFIGLAECLVALTGKHHGESEKSQELGLKIVSHMRDKANEFSERYQHNFSVLATPAEGLSGKFTAKDRKEFGIIKGVTDKIYYTNSNHVPVYYYCSPKHKAEVEGPYHELTRGGHIFYVEIDGDATHNPQAIMDIVDLVDKYNIGYCSVNHNRNRCLDCGYEDAQDDLEVCPKCGGTNIDKLQRITGYLVGTTDRWNKAKLAELHDRVVHK